MLLSQIFATPIHISAAGYFKMDREQIPSVSSLNLAALFHCDA